LDKQRPLIRTPDQRLRVFISSTLKELADERVAARASVEGLQMIPVMFELGARPHPPKDLYQAYLKQSDIFVGIYWQSYGWIAEGETISGIEDEYRLSDSHPRLIYVKEPAPDREKKLNEMFDDIRSRAGVSYKSFSTAEELGKLLTNDLAILLSERFYSAELPEIEEQEPERVHTNLSAHAPIMIGRDKDLESIKKMILADNKHLITITGPGGIGKTRLATVVSKSLTDSFEDGVFFIDLSDISEERHIFGSIASELGLHLSKAEDPVSQINGFLGKQKILLVLDNFEHLTYSSAKISSLFNMSPNLTVIVTSRSALNLSIETEYRLQALAIPTEKDEYEDILNSPSVELFITKAKTADPAFALTEENSRDIAMICRLLDGMPLAIGLAAVKVKVFTPKMIVDRLNNKLGLLSGGSSDAPARHQTMSAAIEWSYDLLNAQEKKLFERLAVFTGGFDFDAIENVCSDGIDNPFEITESLINKYLLKKETEVDGIARYNLPGLFLEFADQLLKSSGDKDSLIQKHAQYFYECSQRDETAFSGKYSGAALRKWKYDAANVIEAADTFYKHGKYPELVNMIYSLWQLFWIFDFDSDLEKKVNLMQVMHEANDLSEEDAGRIVWLAGASALAKGDYISAEYLFTQAMIYFKKTGNKSGYAWANHLVTSIHAATIQKDTSEEILKSFEESACLFHETGDFWGECGVLQNTAALEIKLKRYSRSLKLYDEFERLAKRSGNNSQLAHILIMRGLINTCTRKYDIALQYFKEGMEYYKGGTSPEGTCYALIILSYYFFRTSNDMKAMFMAGVLENLMLKFGFVPWQMLSTFTEFVRSKVMNAKKPKLKDEYDRGMNLGVYKAIRTVNEMVQEHQ